MNAVHEHLESIALLEDPTINPDQAAPTRKMGRHFASQSFLKALEDASLKKPKIVRRCIPNPEIRRRVKSWSTLFLGDPNLAPFAFERCWSHPADFSLLGITHTLSTPAPLQLLPQLPSAPLFPWDALICTSSAAKSAVESIFSHADEMLVARGGFPAQRPALPIIPLGIDTDVFAQKIPRLQARNALAIPQDAIVVLWTGRLELHCKAHHAATFQALSKAQKLHPDQPWVLLMYGTAVMKQVPDLLKELAQQLCPQVRVYLLDGHNLELGAVARAASNIFLSLVDCLQETFGLTPVEAMAAGLPVVVSDWNGYRDTVVHGNTGYCIQTQSFNPGWDDPELLMLANQESSLDRLSTRISSQIHVDTYQAGRALAHLAHNPSLSQQMGRAGQRHVRQHFSWQSVLQQYAALIVELTSHREAAKAATSAMKPLPPLQSIFRNWPTKSLSIHTHLRIDAAYNAKDLDQTLRSAAFRLFSSEIASATTIRSAYQQLAKHGCANLDQLRQLLSEADLPQALGWLIKNGFVVAES